MIVMILLPQNALSARPLGSAAGAAQRLGPAIMRCNKESCVWHRIAPKT